MNLLGYEIANPADDRQIPVKYRSNTGQPGGRQLAKLAHDRTLNKLLCRHDTLGMSRYIFLNGPILGQDFLRFPYLAEFRPSFHA